MPNFKDYALQHGCRKAATKLMDTYFQAKFKFPLSDLPDSASMCNAIDELEEVIESNLDNLNDENVKNIIRLIVEDFCDDKNIENIIMD